MLRIITNSDSKSFKKIELHFEVLYIFILKQTKLFTSCSHIFNIVINIAISSYINIPSFMYNSF